MKMEIKLLFNKKVDDGMILKLKDKNLEKTYENTSDENVQDFINLLIKNKCEPRNIKLLFEKISNNIFLLQMNSLAREFEKKDEI